MMENKPKDSIWDLPRQSFKQMRQEIRPALPLASRARLLIADDEEESIELFAEATAGWEYELVAAKSILETRAVLDHGEPLSGALLDVVFLNGDGVRLYRWIAKNRPALDCAFLTNYATSQLQDLVGEIGPARVFGKNRLKDSAFVDQLMLQFKIGRRTPGK